MAHHITKNHSNYTLDESRVSHRDLSRIISQIPTNFKEERSISPNDNHKFPKSKQKHSPNVNLQIRLENDSNSITKYHSDRRGDIKTPIFNLENKNHRKADFNDHSFKVPEKYESVDTKYRKYIEIGFQ